ncbi:MAG TPA: TRAP transporter TatT component family protein [Polyangiaceae bacterium]|nr:TRAP transporter TatT component family protein [Polyangiaceae bacterium]
MSFLRGIGAALLLINFSLAGSGCLKKVLIDGQVTGTLEGSEAINTFQDYDIARAVAQGGMGQIEGMHHLEPNNTEALFMLTRGWSGIAYAFMEDDYEAAYEKGDEPLAEYHLSRARAAYRRAIYYGVELLGHHAEGFEAARINTTKLRAWLQANFRDQDQAEELLWIGFAHVGLVNVSKDIPEIVSELYIGEEIVRRSVALDEKVRDGMGHVVLGAYSARHAMSELDLAKRHFDRAMEINGGKFLSTQLNYAKTYYCMKGDRPAYDKLLKQVLAAPDTLPEARLQNTIAKRRARRYLSNKVWQEECGFHG